MDWFFTFTSKSRSSWDTLFKEKGKCLPPKDQLPKSPRFEFARPKFLVVEDVSLQLKGSLSFIVGPGMEGNNNLQLDATLEVLLDRVSYQAFGWGC